MSQITVNVASYLAAQAQAYPERVAVYCPSGKRLSPADAPQLTFQKLHAYSDILARGLQEVGIRQGTRVVLMVPPSLDFFALTFALFKVAAVPVMVDPGMGIKNLGTCLKEAEPEAFIGIPKAHFARRVLGWARGTLRTTINVGWSRQFCTHSLLDLESKGRAPEPFSPPEVQADDTAAILFTSGSTGVAKGAVYTHGIFSEQVRLLKAVYGIEPGETDLCTFPLFALFGPALGMTCVVPRMNPSRPATIDPETTFRTIEQYQVTNLFGSPAVIRRLGEHGERKNLRLPTVRRAISAGAPASAANIARFAKLLNPGVQVFTPYGATEALPVANIGSDEITRETRTLTEQGHGVCIGRPAPGVTVSVIPISDEPIATWQEVTCCPTGTIGELVIRGPIVTREYFHRPEATRLSKIVDSVTGEILHRMGDVGYWDEQGRLWFCGRKSHRVETDSGTWFTDCIEPIFNTVPGVERTALVGVNGVPVLCIEPSRTQVRGRAEILADMRRLAAEHPQTATLRDFEFHAAFPVDVRHNSKIFRERLAEWVRRKRQPGYFTFPWRARA